MTLPPIAPIVRTVHKGPTDHRGSRIVATNVTSGARKVVPWDYALDSPENHFLAARTVLGDGWFIRSMCSEKSGGFLFAAAWGMSKERARQLWQTKRAFGKFSDVTPDEDAYVHSVLDTMNGADSWASALLRIADFPREAP